MPSLVITPDDVKTLKEIVNTFSRNVIAAEPDAIKTFTRAATLGEKFGLAASKIALAANPYRGPEAEARAVLNNAGKALTIMQRAFDGDTLARALPQVGNEQRVIDICRDLGANAIADLAEKSRQLRKAPKPPAPKPGA